MGVNLRELLIKHKIELEDLKGKKLAVDTYNILFQFLSTIRGPDGTPLKDSKGNVTSHLSGLFYRTINLLEAGIKPVFVFDGQAPEEKVETQIAREAIREEARAEYAKALAAGQLEEARKFAQQTSRLTKDMVHESKELLSAMGLPWIQALAEGEAQAAYMCSHGDAWAVASQDYDSLLFAAPRLVRNLTITGKRKVNQAKSKILLDPAERVQLGAKTVDVEIEIIDLAECLNFLSIDIKQLVELGLLAGTDYNPGGVSGIGPKTALKVVREGKFSDYASKVPNAERLKQLFLKPLVAKDYSLEWKAPNPKKIKEILVERHEFSENRIDTALKRLEKAPVFLKGLSDFV